MPSPSHRCLLCGTQYYAPGECDWCPVQLTPIMDESFFQRSDAAYHEAKVSGGLAARDQQRAEEAERRFAPLSGGVR